MKAMKAYAWIALVCTCLPLTVKMPAQTKSGSDEINLLSWGAGALVVVAPPSYSDTGEWSLAQRLMTS